MHHNSFLYRLLRRALLSLASSWLASSSARLLTDRGSDRTQTCSMNVSLNPEVETKLARLAAERGSDAEALASEAIERFVNYDEWFLSEVEKGLAQIDEGKTLTHEQVGTRIEKLLSEKLPAA